MFCENCGQPNPDGADFCEICGAALAAPVIAPEPVKKKKAGLIIGITVLVVALVVALLLILGAFKAGSLKMAEKYVTAALKADGKTYYNSLSPYYRDWEEDGGDSKSDLIEEIDEELEEVMEEKKENGIKRSAKNFKLKKKYKKSEVKAIEEHLEQELYECDEDKYKIQEVHLVEFVLVEKEDGETDEEEIELVLLKIKGKWYVEDRIDKATIKEILND